MKWNESEASIGRVLAIEVRNSVNSIHLLEFEALLHIFFFISICCIFFFFIKNCSSLSGSPLVCLSAYQLEMYLVFYWFLNCSHFVCMLVSKEWTFCFKFPIFNFLTSCNLIYFVFLSASVFYLLIYAGLGKHIRSYCSCDYF